MCIPVLANQQKHSSALCRHLILSREHAKSDGWLGERERESRESVMSANLDD